MEVIRDMSEKLSRRELVRVAVSTAIVHFMLASALGYTFQFFTGSKANILFTIYLSVFWSLFGAGMVWKRERDYISAPLLENFIKQYFGIDESAQKIWRYAGLLDYCYFPCGEIGHRR